MKKRNGCDKRVICCKTVRLDQKPLPRCTNIQQVEATPTYAVADHCLAANKRAIVTVVLQKCRYGQQPVVWHAAGVHWYPITPIRSYCNSLYCIYY